MMLLLSIVHYGFLRNSEIDVTKCDIHSCLYANELNGQLCALVPSWVTATVRVLLLFVEDAQPGA